MDVVGQLKEIGRVALKDGLEAGRHKLSQIEARQHIESEVQAGLNQLYPVAARSQTLDEFVQSPELLAVWRSMRKLAQLRNPDLVLTPEPSE